MKLSALGSFVCVVTLALAQERCDAPYPNVYCNTTEILRYQSSSCTDYHIFIARGSDEPYPGRLGNITKEICSSLGGSKCGFESIEYPAKSTAWGKDEWCKSAGKGAKNGQAQIKTYAERCSSSKLIVLGFSQGAAVVQDILGGGGGKVFECEQPFSPALDATTFPGSSIVAAATFGAVIRSKNQNFTVGDGINFDGQRARSTPQLADLSKYSNVFRDYCHYGDPMCAVGSEPANVWVHLDYFYAHNEEVISWVSKKAQVKIPKATSAQISNASTSAATQPTIGFAVVISTLIACLL